MIKIVIVIFAFLIIREVLAILLGWGSDGERSVGEFISDVKHNRAIDKKWKEDGCPTVYTTIGWRPDPIYKEDGFKENPPDGREYFGDGKTYSKVVRRGK